MSDELNSSLAAVFLQEAEEGLAAIEQALIALDANPEAVEPLNEVFRIAHTIKGGAAMADFPGVAEFAHRFEDALTVIRDGHVPVTPDTNGRAGSDNFRRETKRSNASRIGSTIGECAATSIGMRRRSTPFCVSSRSTAAMASRLPARTD